ncbi:MAG: GGDEF domain-containing protein [Candidatus Zambryskibacteria bacterium]|nr:GGDEF domain-containing protein [Candidatus Zambryskibacteria bacterium]
MSEEEIKEKEKLLERIDELESQVQKLEKDLIHDSLTKLKTRSFFEEEAKVYLDMAKNLEAGKRRQWFGFKNISFLFIDIDHFKEVNDNFGHNTGDMVLKEVSDTIKKRVRMGDTVARWGGEEIVVSLLGAGLYDAEDKAEDIRKSIEELEFPAIPELKVTVSIGVVSSEKSDNFEEMIKNADKAMYKSKEFGRNKVTVF